VRWRRLCDSREPAQHSRNLTFGDNQIGDEGARALAEALRQPGACPALQDLTFGQPDRG
jgi:hypothetical protein